MSLKTHQGMPRHKKDKIISICRPWDVSLPLILINLISIIANIPFRSLSILGVYKETYSLKMNENCATRVSQKPFLRSSFSWFRLRYNSRTQFRTAMTTTPETQFYRNKKMSFLIELANFRTTHSHSTKQNTPRKFRLSFIKITLLLPFD